MRKKKEEEDKGERQKNVRKTPSTHGRSQFMSPKMHLKTGTNKSREKDLKTSRSSRGGL